MARFFTAPEDIKEGIVTLTAEDTEHIRSLRLRPDERFIVCDGSGYEYVCRLGKRQKGTDAGDGTSTAEIIERRQSRTEPTIRCTMFIAYAKGERLDYAVQKSVELGATSIGLYSCERCVSRPGNRPGKVERLQKIALETAKQSGRGIIPDVFDAGDISDAADMAVTQSDLSLLFYEDEKNLHLITVMQHYFPVSNRPKHPGNKIKSIAIITGPEGGFEPSEVMLAKTMDIPVITLGPRILRSETAPVAALTAIMYHTGNL